MPMRIDLDLRWGAAVSGIDRVAGKLDAVSKKLGTLQGQLNGIGANPGGGSGGGSGASGGAGGGGGSRGSGGTFIQGRWQRLLKAQGNLQKALQTRNAYIITDAQEALDKAKDAVAGRQTSTFGQRLMQLISTTRWTPGQGFAPLLGRIGALAGGGGGVGRRGGGGGGGGFMLGPPIILAVVGALKLLEMAAKTAAAAVSEIRDIRMLTGGTEKQSAFLRSLGIEPGAAGALRERLASDPYAARTGRQLGGGVTLPRPYGKVNEAEGLEKMLLALSKIDDPDQRLRKARTLGLDPYMKQIELLRLHGDEMKADSDKIAEATKKLSPAFLEFEYQTGRLKNQLEMGVLNIGKSIGDNYNWTYSKFESVMDFLLEKLGMSRGNKGKSDPVAATTANTNAIQENTALLKAGLYGGGSRFRGGMPASLKGDTFQRGVEMKAITMGAFSL